jgi:hypothetical protein
VVGYIVWVCVSTLYDVRTMTKSPNDTFLRTYPGLKCNNGKVCSCLIQCLLTMAPLRTRLKTL